ncbi:zinc finger protein 429-like [Lucilia sericata]|uniref:zinc finger protein 429-like n=1 Tax=Lucilia sericata TaxID=13632 RepID=UPI0018A86EDF|nr:zinc finger protein 429-like [Lucilia sericata]
MNSQEFKKNICRICLDESVVLDWNDSIYGYSEITYKDCYYKYTQLEWLDFDSFSPMLCQICANGLQNVHALILKALESYKYFQESAANINTQIVNNSTNIETDIKYTPTEFETVLVHKLEVEPIIEDHFVYDNSDEDFKIKPTKTKVGRRSKRYISLKGNYEKYNKKSENPIEKMKKVDNSNNNMPDLTPAKSQNKTLVKRKAKKQVVVKENNTKKSKSLENVENTYCQKNGETRNENICDQVENVGSQIEAKVKKKYKEIKKPRMCSICSKILHNKYAVQMHEKTHMENRERKETCKVCGLKFYDKRNLYSHKRIHKENREKRHKCEFCNKAFYDKGGLNIHRRIHLGQMIPCTLCSKQYYRQIDLDRHMGSHSATTINTDTKKRSRYFVRCQHCDKSILSTSFKSHTAAHLNEPLMKCSICNKEFFRRGSCVLHVKKVHQKTNEEYNDFIVQYKKNRISHLFLEQKADIQFSDE